MIGDHDGDVTIVSEGDIVIARRTVRDVATELGFSATEVTRIVTAASELTRNAFKYGGGGIMRWRLLVAMNRSGIELAFEDHGPGIADIKQAMQPGFTTTRSLGMGLPGAKRLMDDMDIVSEVGKGTLVTVRKWLKR